jgi:hypothetical protein
MKKAITILMAIALIAICGCGGSSVSKPSAEQTALFSDIYFPLAMREESFDYDNVMDFINEYQYKTEITEETADAPGSVFVYDENGDYVYISLLDGQILSVTYHQTETNNEVVMSNFAQNGKAENDTFTTHHIGDSEEKVSSIIEQTDFLFK